ncbi:MAG: phasin family protein [Alphaproteobacteria bacterium]
MAIQNPYADMMKYWSEARPQLASFDLNEAIAYGKRNAEAFSAAGQAFAESAQAIARRQVELAQAHVADTLKTAKALVIGSPESNTHRHVDWAKNAIETSINNLREVTELAAKSGFEVFDVLNRRATEQLEELTAAGKKAASAAATATTKKAA